MKNTTMLKAVLLKYSILLNMDDSECFRMTLTDKQNGKTEMAEGNSWTAVIRKAYGCLLKDMREQNLQNSELPNI